MDQLLNSALSGMTSSSTNPEVSQVDLSGLINPELAIHI